MTPKPSKIHHRVPDAAPSPATARYSHAVAAGGFLYVTGQLPVHPDQPEAPLPDGIEAQTELCFLNFERILAQAGFEFADTVFARIFLRDFERDYAGLNRVFHRYYADDDTLPARTTVGVAYLGREALVEIDLVLYRAP